MKSKVLLAVAAVAIAFAITPAYAGKSKKAHKPQAHHKSHHIKGWKACKGAYKYLKGGKCLDSRSKKSKG